DKAALILINESAKSYNDLAKARAEITAKVYDKFGFWLEQEPVELQ
ncbi:UDP-N-acetylmuramate dehydrogenase, partial [Candidatus Saccharibacteria bacterium]|nr:UDP-N-acetylmuramate dehydrogenase [Candidatus Saccharibacteria bacterium]